MITMEKITFLAAKDLYDQQYKFIIEQNTDYQKLQFYQGSVYSFNYTTKKETDTHIYWSTSNKKPMLENDKLFFKHKNIEGASYDKETKKIKIWFGKKFNHIDSIMSSDILKTLVPWYEVNTNLDFMNGNHNSYLNMMTNEILNKMVKGTIKDTKGIIDAFCKYSPYRNFNLNTKKIEFIINNSSGYWNIRNFKLIFLASKEPNDVINYIHKNLSTHYVKLDELINISRVALSIGQNIDINWSHEELVENKMKMLDCRQELKRIHNGLLGLHSEEVEDLPF